MRRACIDIGSNTTRLLVADCGDGALSEVHQARAFTAIGQSLDAQGAIPEQKLQEVTRAVASQLATARELGVGSIRCVATAGVRRAANGCRLVQLISELCEGLEVEVLTGEAEARLAFIGAAWGLRRTGEGHSDGALGVVDVGGGSSELVVGVAPEDVVWSRSLPIGSSDLTCAEVISDPPTASELEQAAQRVREAFAGIQPPAVTNVVAVGGSATSLRRLAGSHLDGASLGHALELLSSAPAAVLSHRFEIDTQRIRLLPGGLLILRQMGELFAAPVTVGSAGLREGLLLQH